MERICGKIWECRIGEQGECCERSPGPWCVQINFPCRLSLSLLLLWSRSLLNSALIACANLRPAERTFLAWLRTSLAFASIGIAVTQLFRLNTTISKREGYTPNNPDNTYHLRQVGKPLGATFLGIAILVLLIGGRRYFESQVCQRTWLESGGASNIRMLMYKSSTGSYVGNSLPAEAASSS